MVSTGPEIIIPVAYAAAGIFVVLRGLRLEIGELRQWRGLAMVAIRWLPIALRSVVIIARTEGMVPALRRLRADGAASILLFSALASAFAFRC